MSISIREKLWLQVGEKNDGSLPSSWFNSFFAYLIVFSIVLVVVGTEFPSGSTLANITSKIEGLKDDNTVKKVMSHAVIML